MKRSVVFLGLCLAIAAGISVAKEAKSSSKAAASICCNFNNTRCSYVAGPGWTTGPRAGSLNDCVDF